MNGSTHSWVRRWLLLIALSGFLPGVIMRCDKAALNFQRGFWEGLGQNAADVAAGILPEETMGAIVAGS